MEDPTGIGGASDVPPTGNEAPTPLFHAYPQDVPAALAPKIFSGKADYDAATFREEFEVCAGAMGWPRQTWLARCFHYLSPDVSRVAKQHLRENPSCSFKLLLDKLSDYFEPSPAVYRAELHRFCAARFDRNDPDGVIAKFRSLAAGAAEPPDRLLRLFLKGVGDASFTSAIATSRITTGVLREDETLTDAMAKFRGWAAIVAPRDSASDYPDLKDPIKPSSLVRFTPPKETQQGIPPVTTASEKDRESEAMISNLSRKLDKLTLVMEQTSRKIGSASAGTKVCTWCTLRGHEEQDCFRK